MGTKLVACFHNLSMKPVWVGMVNEQVDGFYHVWMDGHTSVWWPKDLCTEIEFPWNRGRVKEDKTP